jgi:uncharacterized protein (DUF2141 family)
MTVKSGNRVSGTGRSSFAKGALGLVFALLTAGCASAVPAVRAGLPPQNTPAFAHYPGTIDVEVKGIPEQRGKLYVELYDRTGYFHYERVLNERIVPVSGASMKVRLEHVPQGRYVVAVSQDANENRLLDTGFFGIPTEAYGFSRDARGTFGPPDFDEAAFDFDGRTAALTVHVD